MLMKRAAYQKMNKLNVSVEARAKSAMAGHESTQRKETQSNCPMTGRQYKSNRSSNLSQKSKNSKNSTGKLNK